MKHKIQRPAFLLMICGLMLVCVTNLITRKYQFPDFSIGIVMGVGIGLELVALSIMVKQKKQLLKDAQFAANYDNGNPIEFEKSVDKMIKGSGKTAKTKGR